MEFSPEYFDYLILIGESKNIVYLNFIINLIDMHRQVSMTIIFLMSYK
jgi:hypothetical protein